MSQTKSNSEEGTETKHNTNTPQELKHKPRPRRSIVGPSGQVSSQEGQNKQPWRDEVNAPTKDKDHPAYRKSKGSVATESDEDRVKAT